MAASENRVAKLHADEDMDPFTFTILTGLLVTVGGAAVLGAFKYSPRAMRRVKRWFRGTNFLILGPAEAGKTSFLNFLQYDQFADIHPTMKTLEMTPLHSFSVDRGGELKLDVSKGFDVPGDLHPQDQAAIAFKQKPQTLILWTSLTNEKTTEWLATFCFHLNRQLLNDPALAKKLKSLTIVMNKQDEVEKDVIKRRTEEIREVINMLRPALQENVEKVAILPCTLLEDKGGERAANIVLLTIAHSLMRTKRLTKRR